MPAVTSAWTSHSPGTARLSFTDGDTLKRFTITDAAVRALGSTPIPVIRRDDITDIDDPGWIFVPNIVTVADGSFDVLIAVLAGDGLAAVNEFPSETVTLVYYLHLL
jgi:hypothetical protein